MLISFIYNLLILTDTKNTENVATSTDESEFEALGQSTEINVRTNRHGQVKTSRNIKRPKPPLPPMKKTPKAPLRRSQRNKDKKEVILVIVKSSVSLLYKSTVKSSVQVYRKVFDNTEIVSFHRY